MHLKELFSKHIKQKIIEMKGKKDETTAESGDLNQHSLFSK